MTAARARLIELAAFAALAWYAAAHWANGLVADASGWRVTACVAIAVVAAGALQLAGTAPRWPAALLRTACTVGAAGAGFVAIGLERRLLAPAHWDELGDGLDRGFGALGSVQWPYAGAEPWAALALLLAIPLVLTVAAALAFWARPLRPVALVLLIALYAVPVTEHRFDGELARGLVLLVLIAAWLWLPRMPERGWRTAAVAAAAIAAAAIVALPAAARYRDHEPWVDYESWNPFAARAAASFDWSHSYGPIDWPRDGTTLMHVRSDERHYWKVTTLDRFDGFRWVRSGIGRGSSPLLPVPYREAWESRFRVTIRGLNTRFFPAAGTPLRIAGADPVTVPASDGTVQAAVDSLEDGDGYTVDAYVPDPTPAQMRSAPTVAGGTEPHVPPALRRYTRISLPGEAAPEGSEEILASPYGDVLLLARRLAEGEPTVYDTVRAVQRHLRSEYAYSEQPPRRRFPLDAFLFEDRIGYCQQFSGAMTLMLRMLGIPSRVAAGFTPGSYNRDTREYRVRDLDAHSWVEVWFTGVGWVPFDPTPSVAPAESQSSVTAASAVGGVAGAGETPDSPGGRADRAGSEPAASTGRAAGRGSASEGWLVAAALLGIGVLMLSRARAVRRPRSEERELAAVRRALAATGELDSPRLTLRQLESRLERTGTRAAVRYVRSLRERRYGPGRRYPPPPDGRRALRRALARGRGPRARWGAFVALPPAPFRRS